MVGIGVCNFFGLNVILTMIKQLGAAQVLWCTANPLDPTLVLRCHPLLSWVSLQLHF
jgi:hypothetical protein